jgi:hypothetical protein
MKDEFARKTAYPDQAFAFSVKIEFLPVKT